MIRWRTKSTNDLLDSPSVRRLGTASNWVSVAMGQSHSLAMNADGKLYAWGLNNEGQLGDGNGLIIQRSSPVRVGTLGTEKANWSQVAAGEFHSLAIDADGELYSWGYNSFGQLGDGTDTNKNEPTKIGTATNWVKVAAGGRHSLAINTDGELYSWGGNRYEQLGDGDGSRKRYQTAPVVVKIQNVKRVVEK